MTTALYLHTEVTAKIEVKFCGMSNTTIYHCTRWNVIPFAALNKEKISTPAIKRHLHEVLRLSLLGRPSLNLRNAGFEKTQVHNTNKRAHARTVNLNTTSDCLATCIYYSDIGNDRPTKVQL